MLTRAIPVGVLTVLALVLSSCSDNSPSSPTTVESRDARALHNTAAIELLEIATLRPNGTVALSFRARCPSGYHVVEGVASIYQGPEGRENIGEGFFTTGCNGFWQHRKVRVFAPEEGFRPGRGRASVSLDVENPTTGDFISASDSRVVKIRRADVSN
jgi:hypothetical protein